MKKKTVRGGSQQRLVRALKRRTKETAYDRFLAALAVVVRGLGGRRQVLLALGWVPVEKWPGNWSPPNNDQIMFSPRNAIETAFARYKWQDRAEWEVQRRERPNGKLSEPAGRGGRSMTHWPTSPAGFAPALNAESSDRAGGASE